MRFVFSCCTMIIWFLQYGISDGWYILAFYFGRYITSFVSIVKVTPKTCCYIVYNKFFMFYPWTYKNISKLPAFEYLTGCKLLNIWLIILVRNVFFKLWILPFLLIHMIIILCSCLYHASLKVRASFSWFEMGLILNCSYSCNYACCTSYDMIRELWFCIQNECFVLHCIVFYCIAVYCNAFYCCVKYYIPLYFIAL